VPDLDRTPVVNEDLLHQPPKKVLLLRVRPLRHHLLELVHHGEEQFLLDLREAQALPRRLRVPLLGLDVVQPGAELPELLVARLTNFLWLCIFKRSFED
jgi:hypothetical protein